jgi:hypothetical protein
MTFKVGWNVDCIVVVAHLLMCTATNQLVTWTESSRWPTCWTRSRSYFTTESQSVSMSWYRVPLWDLWADIISCRNVAVWNLRSCIYWAHSLTRGRVCNLQCNHSIVRVTDPCRLVNCLEADSRENTARNNTCFVAIVGYHGNSVYRAVAWIPICVRVTSVAIW